MVTEVVGRDGELSRLADLLQSACAGDGGVLVLRGEAGIGKSALVEVTARRARALGMTVLAGRGTPGESRLPFGALHQVLWPLLRDGALPAAPRETLRAAFGQASVATPDLYGVAFAALDLLSEAVSAGPLLVTAEDAHWFDAPTTAVLSFVGQRLRSLPAAMVIAVRDDCDAFTDSGLAELVVGPLTDGLARELLAREGGDLPLGTRARLLDAARGNPLALLELPAAVRSSAENEAILGSLLPVTTRLERAFTARLPDMPETTKTALLTLAADSRCTLGEIVAVTAELRHEAVSVATIEPAVAARLVHSDGTLLRFRHPLVASAVYQDAPLAHRVAVHAKLAGLMAGDPDRSLWHRAAAAFSTDPVTTADLVDFARRAAARGAISMAVDALEHAAIIAGDARQASALLLQAAKLAAEMPHGKDRALRLIDKIVPDTLDVGGQARCALVADQAGRNPDNDVTMVRPLVRHAIAAWEQGDQELAQAIMEAAALRCWMNDAPVGLRTWVAAALNRINPQLSNSGTLHSAALLLPQEQGRALVHRVAQLRATADEASVQVQPMIMMHGLLGEWDSAAAGFAVEVPAMRARGRITRVALYLGWWSLAEIWTGEWDQALAHGLEAEQLAGVTGDPLWRLFAIGYQAWIFALRGQAEEAGARAAQITADPHAPSYFRSVAERALGISALNAGRPEEAFDRLSRLFDPADPLHHYGLTLLALEDLADAARGCGRVTEAQAIVGALTRQFEATAAPSFHAALRYARAILADDEEAGPLLSAALASGLPPWPYHRARLHLAYGKWLRRRHRDAESRAPLRLALEILDRLGASHWAAQARGELRAAGELCQGQGVPVLSAQELRIAELAARGRTNREIGQLLSLSPRTIGAHLYRIFPKLGITSRVQLAAVLAAQAGA